MPPEVAFDWCMAVSRPVVPITVFGLKAVHRTIVVRVAPGLISPAAVAVKFVNCRFVPFLELATTVTAIAASFALGPRISGYCQNKTH